MEKSKQNQNSRPNTTPNMNGYDGSFDSQNNANVDPEEQGQSARQTQVLGRHAVLLLQKRREELFGGFNDAQGPNVHAHQSDEEPLITMEQLGSTTEETERQREADREEAERQAQERQRQEEAERQRQEAEQERMRREAEQERMRQEAEQRRREAEAARQRQEAERRRQEEERIKRQQKQQQEEAERQERERKSSGRQKPGEELSEAEEMEKAQDEIRKLQEEAERRRKEAAEKNIPLTDQAEYVRAHIERFLTRRDFVEFNSFNKDDMRGVIETILSRRELGESDRLIYVDFLRKAQFNDPAEVLKAQISGYLTYKYPLGGRTIDTATKKEQTQYRF